MTRISSKMTFFHKRIFPLIWFGALAVFVVAVVVGMSKGGLHDKHGNPIPAFIAFLMPFVMFAVGLVVMNRLIFPLADEVYDSVDFLVIRKGDIEEKIAFANIRNVSYQNMINPPRVTLSLREDTRLGREISFIPTLRFGEPFRGKNPVVEALIDRKLQPRKIQLATSSLCVLR